MEDDEQKEYAFRRGDIMQRSELPAAWQLQQSPQQTAQDADWHVILISKQYSTVVFSSYFGLKGLWLDPLK